MGHAQSGSLTFDDRGRSLMRASMSSSSVGAGDMTVMRWCWSVYGGNES